VAATNEGEVFEPYRLPAGPADSRRMKFCSATVPKHHGLHVVPTMRVAPLLESDKYRKQVTPCFGEPILVAWRVRAVSPALDHADVFQFAQPSGKKGSRRTSEGSKVRESLEAVEHFSDDWERVSLPNDLQSIVHRTGSSS
jgi:hypothetical protein